MYDGFGLPPAAKLLLGHCVCSFPLLSAIFESMDGGSHFVNFEMVGDPYLFEITLFGLKSEFPETILP